MVGDGGGLGRWDLRYLHLRIISVWGVLSIFRTILDQSIFFSFPVNCQVQ